ncbi:MAG: OmpH family outer membrane protein [Verrucomicrobiaceae bacterium]|nr:OmpH family outer membrane protein [Verrucomicrobiaceae bacterium]
MKRLALIALVSSAFCAAHAADLKFGVVDMQKAFAEFHKTKDASGKFKDNVDKAQREVNERWSVYKNLLGEIQKLQKETQDPIVNNETKAKKGAELQDKAKELRALEQEIGEFQNRRQGQLKQEDLQIRKGLYDEIITVVKDKAKADGYDFVFDKSGISLTTVPVLLYYKDAVDFTDQVIVELNKDAPPDTGKKADKKESDDEKPAKSSKSGSKK